jgi:hypothetical protein
VNYQPYALIDFLDLEKFGLMSHVEENLAHRLPQGVVQNDFIKLREFLGVTVVGQSAHLWTVLEIELGVLEDQV